MKGLQKLQEHIQDKFFDHLKREGDGCGFAFVKAYTPEKVQDEMWDWYWEICDEYQDLFASTDEEEDELAERIFFRYIEILLAKIDANAVNEIIHDYHESESISRDPYLHYGVCRSMFY